MAKIITGKKRTGKPRVGVIFSTAEAKKKSEMNRRKRQQRNSRVRTLRTQKTGHM